MAVDMFLKIDGVTGESKDSKHTGCIDAVSFHWGASQPNIMSVGGGGGAGKVSISDLSVHAYIDKATPTVFGLCASGKHIATVTLTCCKAGGEQIEYTQIELKEVLITATDFNGAGSADRILISYSFQAAKVIVHYWEQSDQGGKGAETQSGWDIKANKST